MRMLLLFVGKTEAGHVAKGLEHYLERIGHYTSVEVKVVTDSRLKETAQRVEDESRRILASIPKGDRVVVLDQRGRAFTSPDFARQLGAWRDQGARRICFVIGGAFGVNDAVRARADLVLALSAMTFPHQLVRVLFAEQLYRALSILEGRGYHH